MSAFGNMSGLGSGNSGDGGKKVWAFRWLGGGYNSVMAHTKAEALALATAMGKPTTFEFGGKISHTKGMTPDPGSFRTGWDEVRKLDKEHAGMFD